MGFNVDPHLRVVSVDHQHNDYAVTTVEGNPVSKNFSGIKVTSVFARTKSRRGRDSIGDNCPMLYALKGMRNLKTGYRSFLMLYQNYNLIMSQIVAESRPQGLWDCIIPIPSSSNLPSLMARSAARHAGYGAVHADLLAKVSARQVMESIDLLKVESKSKAKLRANVKHFIREHDENTAFQLKSVDKKLRKHLCPFSLAQPFVGAGPHRILLVDDMVTSGTSIVSAGNLLLAKYPGVHIDAITLFGST